MKPLNEHLTARPGPSPDPSTNGKREALAWLAQYPDIGASLLFRKDRQLRKQRYRAEDWGDHLHAQEAQRQVRAEFYRRFGRDEYERRCALRQEESEGPG